ncbi:MAG: glycosyltransferase family 1 protein [Candidatus Levyibacteriota bacterium]
MIIGIDGNEANIEAKVGISEYAYELLCQFSKIASSRKDLKFKIYLKSNPRVEMPVPTENWQYQIVHPKKFWTQIGLPLKLFMETKKPDVFFSPSHYAPRFSPVPTAISIMDLSYIHFPELFTKHDLYQLVNWTKYSAKNAKKIFTISNFSRDDIIKTYKKKLADVVTTYLGIKEILSNKYQVLSMDDLNKKFGIEKPYILFVGTLQPRKNIVKLIEAFSLLKNKDVELVIVGKKGWLWEDIFAAPEKFKVAEKVKFLDFVGNEDLPSFYKNALCFVLPSLYEGFGLPVLEAMKFGCPTVISDVSSLPEVGGDACLYVDPQSVDDIAQKLNTVISDEKLRAEMVKKGYNQVKKFSWEKTAKETLKALEELGKQK